MRIHQPEDEEPPLTRPRLVDQLEWLDLVLERIGENQEAALGRGDGAQVLEGLLLSESTGGDAEYFSQRGKVIFGRHAVSSSQVLGAGLGPRHLPCSYTISVGSRSASVRNDILDSVTLSTS